MPVRPHKHDGDHSTYNRYALCSLFLRLVLLCIPNVHVVIRVGKPPLINVLTVKPCGIDVDTSSLLGFRGTKKR